MTNPYYNPTGNPAPQSRASSAVDRAEFAAIGAAFNLLPTPAALAGNQQNYVIDAGTVNAMAVPAPPNITALSDGMAVTVLAAMTCTGPATIAIGSLPATPITRQDGTALQPGDYVAEQILTLRYCASQGAFQLAVSGLAAVAQAQVQAGNAAASATSAANSASLAQSAIVARVPDYVLFAQGIL
jgi:hypothetical protein